MQEQYSRRDLLRRYAQAGAGLVAGAGLSFLLAGCEKKPPKDHITYHELFDGDVKITRTETTQANIYGNWIQAVKLDLDINQSGNYLFEGWVGNYRARDTLGEKWEYGVGEVPFKKERDLSSWVYRLEASRVGKDGSIERDTEEFRHHGIRGSFNIQGQPVAM